MILEAREGRDFLSFSFLIFLTFSIFLIVFRGRSDCAAGFVFLLILYFMSVGDIEYDYGVPPLSEDMISLLHSHPP